MKPAALLLLPLLALPLALRAAPSNAGLTALQKGAYRFEISTASRTGDWFGWWGASNDFPGKSDVVTNLKAFRGKTRLVVPISSFAGLADAHTFELRETKGGMELRIVGSDAGESWRGAFRFDREALIERTIRSGEFPDIDYERTTYRRPREGEIE